jgi:hypothetical protein
MPTGIKRGARRSRAPTGRPAPEQCAAPSSLPCAFSATIRLPRRKQSARGASRRARGPAIGAVAQLGERLNGIQEVDGSIPFGSTNRIKQLRGLSAALLFLPRLRASDRAPKIIQGFAGLEEEAPPALEAEFCMPDGGGPKSRSSPMRTRTATFPLRSTPIQEIVA